MSSEASAITELKVVDVYVVVVQTRTHYDLGDGNTK